MSHRDGLSKYLGLLGVLASVGDSNKVSSVADRKVNKSLSKKRKSRRKQQKLSRRINRKKRKRKK